MRTTDRKGSVLATVAVMLLIIGVLAMFLMDRTLSSSQRATWSRDHVAVRMLAESCAEDLFARISKDGNDPSTETFRFLRTILPDEGDPVLPVQMPVVPADHFGAELVAFQKSMGHAQITCEPSTWVTEAEDVSDDGIECRGTVRIVVQMKFSRARATFTEQVRIDREFRVARHTLHHPLQEDALLLKRKPRKPAAAGAAGEGGEGGEGGAGGEGGQGGGEVGAAQAGPRAHSYHSAHVPGSRKMTEVIGGEDGSGMYPSPDRWVEEIAFGLSMLHPRNARPRAQFVGRHPRQLMRFIDERLEKGKPVTGLYFSGGRRPLMLTFPRFSGRAVIVARGPVVVGDIRMADPSQDSLTIVSGRRIRVVGANVEANLVSFGGRRKRVQFAVRTKITGTVISTRQPKSRGLAKEEYEACEISGVPGENYEGNLDVAPPEGSMDMEELEKYTVVFAPETARVSHAVE